MAKWTSNTSSKPLPQKEGEEDTQSYFNRGEAFARGIVFLCLAAILLMLLGGAVQLLGL
jgi:hypothetical protein